MTVSSCSDACPSQQVPLNGSSIMISWEETELSEEASVPCPCQNITLQHGRIITRHCGGSYSQGAVWSAMDYSQCGLNTKGIILLCEALLVRELITSEHYTCDPALV